MAEKMSESIEEHKKDLANAKKLGNRAREGLAYSNLGNDFFSRGDFTQAVEYHKQHLSIALEIGDRAVACVAGVNGKGEGERERGRKMGFWELGTRERLLQRPHFFISAHRFLGKPIKLAVNTTTNQKQARAFLHD